MASNFNGDLEDSTISENPQLSSSSESRTKSVDEVVAEMEEQNRWAEDDKKIRKIWHSLCWIMKGKWPRRVFLYCFERINHLLKLDITLFQA